MFGSQFSPGDKHSSSHLHCQLGAGGRFDVVVDGANVGHSLPGSKGFRSEAIMQFLRQLNDDGRRGAALRALVVLPHHYAPPDDVQKQWARWGHAVFVPRGRSVDYDDHAWFSASLGLLEPGRHAVYCATNDNMGDLADVLVSSDNRAAFREWRDQYKLSFAWDRQNRLTLSWPQPRRCYAGSAAVASPFGTEDLADARSFHFSLLDGTWLCLTAQDE